MTITYFSNCKIALITDFKQTGEMQEIHVEDAVGRPLSATVIVNERTYRIRGSVMVESDILVGDVYIDIDGATLLCGTITEDKQIKLPVNDNTLLALTKALDYSIRLLDTHAKRIKDLETSAYGVDIMNLG